MILVGKEITRNASTSAPVGMSNVRIILSYEQATSHLESGENVYIQIEQFG